MRWSGTLSLLILSFPESNSFSLPSAVLVGAHISLAVSPFCLGVTQIWKEGIGY